MKKFLILSMFSVLTVFLVTGSAMAVPFTYGDGGTALQGVLDGITVDPDTGTVPGESSVDVSMDSMEDESDSYWNITGTGGSLSTVIIELASFAASNSFGVYDTSNPANYVELFAGADEEGDQVSLGIQLDGSVYVNFSDTGVDFAGYSFGYYLNSSANEGGGLWHSDTSLNSDKADHMVAFQGTDTDTVQIGTWGPGLWTDNEFVLAFEDYEIPGADADYTDFVAMVESVNPNPVPEPATMMLLGSGLIGLAGFGRRKFFKKG